MNHLVHVLILCMGVAAASFASCGAARDTLTQGLLITRNWMPFQPLKWPHFPADPSSTNRLGALRSDGSKTS